MVSKMRVLEAVAAVVGISEAESGAKKSVATALLPKDYFPSELRQPGSRSSVR